MKIVVVGAGIIGSACFYELSKKGYEVTLIEQKHIGSGTTSYSGGMLRCFHFNNEKLQNLAIEGLEYYKNFKKIVGIELFLHRTGYLFLAQRDYTSVINSLSKNTKIQILEASYASTLFKAINFQGINQILFEEEAGWVNPMHACYAWVTAGIKNNGLLLENCILSNIRLKSDKVIELQTNFGLLVADKVIFCNGIWNNVSNRDDYEDIKLRHIQINLYKIQDRFEYYPCFLDEENEWYGKFEQKNYMWLGQPYPNHVLDISGDIASDINSAKELVIKAQNRFHWLRNSTLVTSKAKLDLYSVDSLPIIKQDEFLTGVYRVIGLSGNGVKLAPAIALKVTNIMEK